MKASGETTAVVRSPPKRASTAVVCRLLLLLGLIAVNPALAAGDGAVLDQDELLGERWTGDFDQMMERRLIRVLVVYNKMLYFLDKGQQRGASYELLKAFEKFVNRKQKGAALKVRLLFIPVPRDQLLTALQEGRGDIAVANLTITEERRKQVDFSVPLIRGIREILITGPTSPEIATLDDLSGKRIHVRLSSSYHEHLIRLNESFAQRGMAGVELVPASEYLEDSDLLEMVNAGILPMAIVDSHKAEFWAGVFEKIKLHPVVAINSGGDIGWAIRKDSPKLERVVNKFVAGHKRGTLLGNILFKRYLKTNKWARNAVGRKALARYRETVSLFQKYAEEYGFDYLMTIALAFQESQLDHRKKSPVGAVGIMQIMPSTAADKNVAIADIESLKNNIHAGIKYLRFLQDRYFSESSIDPLNRMLFTFAAYNAGPQKIAALRTEAEELGLDPNTWFQHVEIVAARRIGHETVQYVSNIFKYYVAYRLIQDKLAIKEKLKADIDL